MAGFLVEDVGDIEENFRINGKRIWLEGVFI
jgi:hypothetical protein